MDNFLESSDSATVVAKDLGQLPKEQFADLITDHSRFPADEEKVDIAQKFPAEVDLLGDSFTMSSNIAPDSMQQSAQAKEPFDDFFLGASDKSNHQQVTSSINNLIDMDESLSFDNAKRTTDGAAEQQFSTVSAPFEPSDDLFKAKDEIESDYMNPYAEVRPSSAEVPPKPEEPSVAVPAASDNALKDDIFSEFATSHNKNDQFAEPTFDDSPPTPASAAAVVPEPVPIVPPPVVPKAVIPEKKVEEPKPKPPPQRVEDEPERCIQAEKLFKQFGLDAWFKPEKLHPKVESLIYWRDVKKSGIVFGSGLSILIAMSLFSLISVFSYVSLLALFGTVSFRIYKNVLQAVQKTAEGHPFKEYLDIDLTLSQEKVQQLTTVAVAHVNALLSELRRLFLVEDLVDSIKFGVVLYCLTYVGAIFNGMTCVIIAFIALFTLPKVYENNKQSIDAYLDLVRSKFLEISEKVKAAVPIGKKVETDKEK